MQIHVYDHAAQAAQAAALLIAAQVIGKPDSVLGFATGSSPIPIYQELVRLHQSGILSFSRVKTFNLDEYCGLSASHECSYHRFMREQLFDHIDIPADQFHLPNGAAEEMERECRAYDAAIAQAGGIDLQLLGIGRNGHIGFNEPSDQFVYGTHVVELTQDTIEANRRFFDSEADVPRRAISMGVGGIMTAKRVILIATGAGKAEAIRRSVCGEIHPENQASILRTHADVVFFLDKEAAAGL